MNWKLEKYEANQNLNFINRWLHSFRYKTLISEIDLFQKNNGIRAMKILDIGCAGGKSFEVLNPIFNIEYVGVELNPEMVEAGEKKLGKHENFKIICDSIENQFDKIENVDIVIALETLEHMPGQLVPVVLANIANYKPKLFMCSVPVEIGPSIWIKQIGSFLMGYKDRANGYSLRETFWAGFNKLNKLPVHNCGHVGFDWRWLEQSLRFYFNIREKINFPFKILPTYMSSSVFFVLNDEKIKLKKYDNLDSK